MDLKTIPDEFIEDTWAAMAKNPHNTFLILTKRPRRMLESVSCLIPKYGILPNLWLGCTVVNQAEADEKIPIFLQVPGKKFLSLEPLLGPIKLLQYLIRGECIDRCPEGNDCSECNPGFASQFFDHQIDAVILGGETGPGSRAMHPDWVIGVVQQCRAAGVPVFVKQIHINGKVSKDMSEWPEELRVRELPWLNRNLPSER